MVREAQESAGTLCTVWMKTRQPGYHTSKEEHTRCKLACRVPFWTSWSERKNVSPRRPKWPLARAHPFMLSFMPIGRNGLTQSLKRDEFLSPPADCLSSGSCSATNAAQTLPSLPVTFPRLLGPNLTPRPIQSRASIGPGGRSARLSQDHKVAEGFHSRHLCRWWAIIITSEEWGIKLQAIKLAGATLCTVQCAVCGRPASWR